MSMKFFVSVVSVGILCAATLVEAHHSFAAQYDANKPITLRGTITRMLWSNPHGHLYIDVKMPDGKLVTWELETASPAGLYRRGWRRDECRAANSVHWTALIASTSPFSFSSLTCFS